MTFNKKAPDVVNLYFNRGPPPASQQQQPQQVEMKRRSYRIAQKEDFIASLQERLRRFK